MNMSSTLKVLLIRLVLCVLLTAFLQLCYAQNKNVIPIPEKNSYLRHVQLNVGGWVSIEKYLPKNYDKSGNTDYTNSIQRAIDENIKLVFPNFPLSISDAGLTVPSNRVLFFQEFSKLALRSSDKGSYQVLRIHKVNNIKIYNLNLEGDRYTHRGKSGEWGMGVSIRESNNIALYNSRVSKFWGDGIYIGTLGKMHSSNIVIDGGVIEENRRNGISVISVDGLKINNLMIANTYGTNPQAGIDFEPNNGFDVLRNIYLSSVYSVNNYHKGIAFYLRKLNNSNSVSISVDGFKDKFSRSGITITGINKSVKKERTAGKIRISNSTLSNNLKAIISFDPRYVGPEIILDKVQVMQKNKLYSTGNDKDFFNSISNGIFKILY